MNKTVVIVLVVLVVGIGGYFLLQGDNQTTQTSTPNQTSIPRTDTSTPSPTTKDNVQAIDQKEGSSVTVASADIVESGYIAIHEDDAGKPGLVIGNSRLLSGSNSNTLINLDRLSKEGEVLYAMLHADDGDSVYEFPGDDAPIKDSSGNVILSKFTIDNSATEVSIKEVDMTSRNFSFSPSNLTLTQGQTAKISFQNSGTHTFTIDELGVNKSLTGSSPTVEFTPTKPGTYEFYCAIPGHRSRGMLGSITVN